MISRILAVAALGAMASAPCDIPVFRYALERWPAGPYEFVCFHRGPLTPEVEAVLDSIEKSSANAEVLRVEVEGLSDKSLSELWASQKNPALPWMVVRFPGSPAGMPSAWEGTPDAETAKQLLDSPSRKETARRILRGDSAVWLLIEGAEEPANVSAARLLEDEFGRLEKRLKLPEIDPEEGPPLRSEVPLKIAFSVLRISRADPREKAFLGMLARTGPELANGASPVALPVIGRGRALWPLSGERLNAAEIAEAAEFLVGACSCQVKDMNPGLDLLFDEDWDKGLAEASPGDPVSAAPPAPAAAPSKDARRSPGIPWIILALLSLVSLVVGLFLLRPRCPRGPC